LTGSVLGVTDWNPLDPDAPNVYYDLSSWTSDQQAELTALLANADIAHAWVESELVVSEEFEDVVDSLFDRLERELGIGTTAVAGGVDDDDETVEFELDEYSIEERREITESLVAARVTHRWIDKTLVVPVAAEEIVDDILDDFDESDEDFGRAVLDN
jgi:predicted Zn-dependent protease with MMP-like domain